MTRSIQRFARVVLLGTVAVLFGNPALAADSGHDVRAISQPFDSLKVDGPIDVLVLQGANASVVVDAPAGIATGIRTVVEGNTLNIDSSGLHVLQFGMLHASHPLVTVTVTILKRIAVDGSSDLHAVRLASSDELILKLSGSGDANLEQINVAKLTTEISGSADVQASGSAKEQSIMIAGSGDYDGANLRGDSVAVGITGSGGAAVWAIGSLAVQIAGSGDVSYWGDPAVSQSVKGSGDVIRRGSKN